MSNKTVVYVDCTPEVAHDLAQTMMMRCDKERSQTKAGEYLAVACVLMTAEETNLDNLLLTRRVAELEAELATLRPLAEAVGKLEQELREQNT